MNKLVIIGTVFPEPESTAAGKRMMQLIAAFVEEGFSVTFLSSASDSEYSENLSELGITCFQIEINNTSFDLLIEKLAPDIVLFDRYITEEQFGWRISEICPNAVKILDTEDLHFLRFARRKAFHENRKETESDLINDIFKREIASVYRCDLSLIISAFEYRLLAENFRIPAEILFYLPFLTGKIDKNVPGFAERLNFASIGNFLHEPNWQTVLKLREIWPEIRRKLPGAEVHIYGAYPSDKVFRLHDEKAGFLIKGRADSSEKIFKNYRVLLAPIPFGAGLKGKLWESMLYGCPNVTTTAGAEGMFVQQQWSGFIDDDPEKFAESSAELYHNSEIWEKSQQTGFAILNQNFNRNDFLAVLFSAIQKISNNLAQHRNRNFMGQILQHHQLNAVKYLSRWIEAKNRKD